MSHKIEVVKEIRFAVVMYGGVSLRFTLTASRRSLCGWCALRRFGR
jgi:hypothetical protein